MTAAVPEPAEGPTSERPGGRLDPASWGGPTVGVLGGLGPAATAVFLDVLVRATAADTDQDHLDLLVSQHSSTPDRTASILDPAAPDPGPVLARDAAMLARTGVEILVLPCNTAHHFVSEVEQAAARAGITFVNIVECTVAAVIASLPDRSRPVAVLATAGTVHARVYQDALERTGLEALIPGPELQADLNTLIYEQVKANRPVDRALYASCLERVARLGAGAAVLGCTELSVIHDRFRQDPVEIEGLTVLDSLTELATATIHAAGKQVAADFR